MSGICLGLDNLTADQSVEIATHLRDRVDAFKLQQIIDRSAFDPKAGQAIRTIQAIGKPVVYDVKLIDIGDAMRRRASEYKSTNGIVTVHGRIDVSHIRSAVDGISGTQTKIYVVTVLTSEDPVETTIETSMETRAVILKRARKAVLAGAHGIVCATTDLEFLNRYPELARLERLTPAIREEGGDTHDQVRVGTPHYAGLHGSTYGVVSRPILQADDPIAAAERIRHDFFRGLTKRRNS